MHCVVKYDHKDGVKLPRHKHELWCGRLRDSFEWVFVDAQHAALADKPICKKCIEIIVNHLNNGAK